jgi:hypothetical protein
MVDRRLHGFGIVFVPEKHHEEQRHYKGINGK